MENTQVVSPEVLAQAQKILAKKEAAGAKRVENLAKYAHALVETLRFDAISNKYSVNIKCVKCGNTERVVHTSDLFQVDTCTACSAEAKKEARASKKAELKAAMDLIRSGKVS